MIREATDLRIDRQVAIGGRVTIGGKAPVTGAVVRLSRMPKEWEHRAVATSSGPTGLFYFLDLPDGEYAVTAGNAPEASASVKRSDAGRIQMAWVDLILAESNSVKKE